MAAETLTPQQEISAARMDMWCATSVLNNVTYWIRIHAGIPQTASVWHAHTILQQRAVKGDKTATRKLREFDEAATAYEGARVALAELVGVEADSDAAIALTGDDARAMREAMAHYAA